MSVVEGGQPEGWAPAKLNLLFQQIPTSTKKILTKDCLPEGKFPVIDQGQSLIAGYCDDSNRSIQIDDPVIVFGDHTRVVKWISFAFVPGADGTKVLNPVQPIQPRYFYYLLRNLDLPDRGYGRHFQFVNEAVVAIAPLAEQKVIADKLDALLAQVDTLRARLEAIPAILKRFRQSVLSAAVTGKLTEKWRSRLVTTETGFVLHDSLRMDHENAGGHSRGNASEPTEDAHDLLPGSLPQSWDVARLQDACTPGRPICYGILMPGPELDEGIPYIRVADFPGNKLRLETIKKTSPAIDAKFQRSKLMSGDLLLSIRGSVGRLIAVPSVLGGANITQDTARISISKRLSADYVRYSLLSNEIQKRMQKMVKGVAVRGINIGDVRALQLPLPSLPEQTEIVRCVETLFAFADQIEARTQEATARVKHLTQSILAKAFRGELTEEWRKAHPELVSGENSAEALLERIRATRATAASSTPRGRKPGARSTSSAPAEASRHLLAAEAPKRRGHPRKT